MIAGTRGLCYGNLAVGVKEIVATNRAQENRGNRLGAEKLRAGIALGPVIEPAREQLEFQEPLAVGAQRDLVVDAGRHVAEMRRRHVLMCDRLKVENVDRVLRTFNQFAVRWCPNHRIGQLGRRFLSVSRYCTRREQRTSSEILQKAAPAGGKNNRRGHSNSSLNCNRWRGPPEATGGVKILGDQCFRRETRAVCPSPRRR